MLNLDTIAQIDLVAALDSDVLTEAFEVNVVGLHRMTTAALPMLKESWLHMLTCMFAMELEDTGTQSFFIGIPPTDTEMQSTIRKTGLNPISKIPQSELVSPDVSASTKAWLCNADARKLDEVLLDVRDERFRSKM